MMRQPDSPLYRHLGNLRQQEKRIIKTHKVLAGQFLHKKHTFHCCCISQHRAGLELEVVWWYVQIYILFGKLNSPKKLFHAPELNGPYLEKDLGYDFGSGQGALLPAVAGHGEGISTDLRMFPVGRLQPSCLGDTGYSGLAGLRTRE